MTRYGRASKAIFIPLVGLALLFPSLLQTSATSASVSTSASLPSAKSASVVTRGSLRIVNKALAKPATQAAFAKLGAETASGSPAEFRAFVHAQLDYWGKVVRDSGMKMHQ